MVFSSIVFLFAFLPAVLACYFLAAPGRTSKNYVLLFFSLLFYAWGGMRLVPLILYSIVSNYCFGRMVTHPATKKRWMILAVFSNIGVLVCFKYVSFLSETLHLLVPAVPLVEIALPVGISFYTFQGLSYVIDVYREEVPCEKNLANVALYVALFPQLVAGPIVRYSTVATEIRHRHESMETVSAGFQRMLFGLGKKVLIANQIGQLADTVFSQTEPYLSTGMVWLGLFAYSFQIYFDFSGYSDMAIGLGKMLGFRFLENFNYPYIAKSITDFWRRWHISLSSWFREYVYIPLGGNRKGKFTTYRNLLIVWFLTGFWHGASWNYILWGLYYFLLLVFEKAFFGKILAKLPSVLQHLYTMFFVILGWLLFVFEDLSAGTVWLGNMFGIGTNSFISQTNLYDLVHNLFFFAILAVASTPIAKKFFYRHYESSAAIRWAACMGCGLILVISTAYLVDSSFNPFLYYRF